VDASTENHNEKFIGLHSDCAIEYNTCSIEATQIQKKTKG